MTRKMANYVILLILTLLGLAYLYHTYTIATERLSGGMGPIQFPTALGIALVVLCAVEITREALGRSEPAERANSRLTIPNLGKLLGTIAAMATLFFLWERFEVFYPLAAVFFATLLLIFRASLDPRFIAIAAGLGMAFALFLYLVFGLAFGIRLT